MAAGRINDAKNIDKRPFESRGRARGGGRGCRRRACDLQATADKLEETWSRKEQWLKNADSEIQLIQNSPYLWVLPLVETSECLFRRRFYPQRKFLIARS